MRLDYNKINPDAIKAVYGLQNYVSRQSTIDERLQLLVQLRASQVNGCAFCTHMHTLELRQIGEKDIRIDCLATWEETDLFDARERAALAWTEAVTLISKTHAPDNLYKELTRHFDEQGIADLTLAIATINVWNRLAISFRQDPAEAPRVIQQSRASMR